MTTTWRLKKTGKYHGHCLTCDYKGLFKTRGSCPNCQSNNVKNSLDKVKISLTKEDYNKIAEQRRRRLSNAMKKFAKIKQQERIHHELFSLFKIEVGKQRYDELVKKAYENLGVVPLPKEKQK